MTIAVDLGRKATKQTNKNWTTFRATSAKGRIIFFHQRASSKPLDATTSKFAGAQVI